MPDTQPWTIGRLLTWTTEYLQEHGADSPRLDAEVLLAEAKGCERIELYTAFDEEASEKTRVAFRELVRRRAEGMPVAYLVGRREFYAMTFHVTPDVLIPRPETEFVVVTLLDLVKQREADGKPLAILDVGTGSGILAICAAKHIADCRVTALDVSPAALEVATRNAAQHQVADRIEFLQSDLCEALAADQQFDFALSNPPYVSSVEFENLAAEVRDHEPRQALLAGDQGTEVIERLVPQTARHLRPGGWLLVEISPMIQAAAEQIVNQQSGLALGTTVKDLSGMPRVVTAQCRR